jgi:hypothetical protein
MVPNFWYIRNIYIMSVAMPGFVVLGFVYRQYAERCCTECRGAITITKTNRCLVSITTCERICTLRRWSGELRSSLWTLRLPIHPVPFRRRAGHKTPARQPSWQLFVKTMLFPAIHCVFKLFFQHKKKFFEAKETRISFFREGGCELSQFWLKIWEIFEEVKLKLLIFGVSREMADLVRRSVRPF